MAFAGLGAPARSMARVGQVATLSPRQAGGPVLRAAVVAKQVLGVHPHEAPSLTMRRLGTLASAAAAVAVVGKRRRSVSLQAAGSGVAAAACAGRTAGDGDTVRVHYEGR